MTRIWLLTALLIGASASLRAATFTVNTISDAVDVTPGDGACESAPGADLCTLRAAVQEANARPGADVVEVPSGTYFLTIPGRQEDAAASGDLDVTDTLTITGAGATATVIDAGGIDRVFDLFTAATISGLTVQGGDPGEDANGGAIFNSGPLALTGVLITRSHAGVSGGGLANDNDATLTDVVVSDNTAELNGGGVDNTGTARLMRVTLSNNMAGSGGGISNDLELTLENVTVSGNQATFSGGGVKNNGTARLTAVTIAGNAAETGGGLQNIDSATLTYVLVADSPSGENCVDFATLTSGGSNLDTGDSCNFRGPRDLVNKTALLGPLRSNGGSTPTHELLPGSPAIDAGGRDCPPPATDQRGFVRPGDGDADGRVACDIGAYEIAPDPSETRSRLDALLRSVEAALPPGTTRDMLTGRLATASARLDAGTQALMQGDRRTAKAQFKKAVRALARFITKLRSRKVKKTLALEVRRDFRMQAAELRREIVGLRRSL